MILVTKIQRTKHVFLHRNLTVEQSRQQLLTNKYENKMEMELSKTTSSSYLQNDNPRKRVFFCKFSVLHCIFTGCPKTKDINPSNKRYKKNCLQENSENLTM